MRRLRFALQSVPWPATVVRTGAGECADTTNWAKGPDAESIALREWAGADFFAPFTLEK